MLYKRCQREIKMDYIQNVLGVTVNYHHWKGELELPYYITERYKMRLVELDTIRCVFVWPKEKLNQIGSLKKQIRRIQMEEELPVVFVMDSMDRYRRTAFIKAHISFVVPDSQLYLPFMGIYLQEKYQTEMRSAEALQPSTQLLLFYWYYANENCIYMNDAVKALGCSAMTVTRAFRQLEETGYFETGKIGVQKYLKGKSKPDEILQMLENSLTSPVADVLYIDKEIVQTSMRPEIPDGKGQGDEGQSFIIVNTADEEKGYPCYAANKKGFQCDGSHELLDAETQAEVQLWKYDPAVLARDGQVDPLSLALSLKKPLFSFIKND